MKWILYVYEFFILYVYLFKNSCFHNHIEEAFFAWSTYSYGDLHFMVI